LARFSRIEVFQIMSSSGVVPLFYNGDVEISKGLVQACYDGGARLLEFTNRGDFAHLIFQELSLYCKDKMPDMILGVGSVTDAATASLYMQLGANFIVTPALREDIALACNRKKVMWSPGCGSLTEICRAEELGCEVVKLFPGGIYGPNFIKAIKGPQPWTNIMPTGGVTIEEENLRSWFDAGATCVGIGSKLVTKEIVANKNYAMLTQRVSNVLKLVKELKG